MPSPWDQPLIDHHCHGLVTDDVDRAGFEALMNEAAGPSPLGTSAFDSLLGLAIRRYCPPLLDLEPHCSSADYLERRQRLGAHEVNARMLGAAGLSHLLVDTGFSPVPLTDPVATAGYAAAEGREIVRLESLAEELLDRGVRGAYLDARVRDAIRGSGAVGVKSIAAYRSGLALPDHPPSTIQLEAAIGDLPLRPDGRHRIAHPIVHGWLAWTAIDLGLPLQFHVGYGDNDVDLADCDPLALTPFLRATQERAVPVMLLHNYPFHRHAAYLAQVFDHVFIDLGLATHNTGALSRDLWRETLELAPFGKLLYSSDAYGLSELYLLGATLFRRAAGAVSDALVESGDMTDADAARLAGLVCCDNARRVYALD